MGETELPGHTVPLERRLASGGRRLQDDSIIVSIFNDFSEALQSAGRCACEYIAQRAVIQQRLDEKEGLQKEYRLWELAHRHRQKCAHDIHRRSASFSDSKDEAVHRRSEARKERRQ
ncbi:hypothetical protein BKA58DRAFT_424726 [Alternaria rosae]|uniref:uncharacterized protein n=1 Tax=Alternaria rosae TaxID=1187941 RepID=UPI001E8D7931|nr:uncharacterized protein BKA58DRAFT_424726 [Alternaria rosae]KAH6857471.1 hypothetical protein BKA58DRAFT_424726 [Alternaria rosae]